MPRVTLLVDDVTTDTHTLQVDAIRKGTGMVLECRRQKRYDGPVMEAAAKLLRVVPEVSGSMSAHWDKGG